MLPRRLNFLLEKLLVLFIGLWGNWGLFYLAAVLGFDCTFTELKAHLYVFALQLLVTLPLLLRLDLGIASPAEPQPTGFGPGTFTPYGQYFPWLCLAVGVAFAVLAYTVEQMQWSETVFEFNLLWALLMPLFLMLVLRYRHPARGAANSVAQGRPIAGLDVLLVFPCAAVLLLGLVGRGFPTPDDAYYGHILVSTLANPDVPILGGDLLFGTDAPFVLHPAYRPVGYEVLVALLASISGTDPVHIYFKLMPIPALLAWVVAVYLFYRVLDVPLPGVALTATLAVLMLWTENFAPGGNFFFIFWGKAQLFLLTVPLVFLSVAAFIHRRSVVAWLLVLLVVAASTTWSSSALFLTPVALGIAYLVLLPTPRIDIPLAAVLLLALAPLCAALGYSLWVLSIAPIPDVNMNAGILRIKGQAFGGIYAQMATLLLLPLLLFLSRTLRHGQFQHNIFRLCMVGYFIVLAPYLFEILAEVLNTQFLARRLHYAYPSMLLVGVVASIAVTRLVYGWRARVQRRTTLAVIASSVLFYAVFVSSFTAQYLFGDWWQSTRPYKADYAEIAHARQLIPDGALVAAGESDDLLPLMPNPPQFTYVRHYLDYHKNFLAQWEYNRRIRLHHLLIKRKPMRGKSLDETLDVIVGFSESLDVTTLVFHPPGGQTRTEKFTGKEETGDPVAEQAFIDALVARLVTEAYDCLATPSGKTWVCNKQNNPVPG